MSSDCIEIALPSDQNYFPGLLVTMYSIAKNAASSAHLSFNILDGGIRESSFELLKESILRVHPKSSFRRFKINEQDYSTFPAFHGNRMTYVRFLLPTMLPENEFVIYADSDTLWLADIADLWRQRDPKVILQAVYDQLGDKTEEPWFKAHKVVWRENRYFCNGLLLMNLNAFRRHRIVEKASEFIANHPDVQFADQSAFNAVIEDGVKLLPERWNCFTVDVKGGVINESIVLHYANQLPWKRLQWVYLCVPFMEQWHVFYKEANFGCGYLCLCEYRFYNKFGLPRLIKYLMPLKIFRWPVFLVLKALGKAEVISAFRFVTNALWTKHNS